ncbi:peptidase M30, partial [Brachyspira hampsonii]|nr:peptidase M30 [Brachyspira hampsonii]
MKKIFFMLFLLSLLSSCQRVSNVLGVNYDSSLTYPDAASMERKSFYANYKWQVNKRYNFYKIAEYDKLIIYVMEGSGYKPESVNYIANAFNNNYAEEV